AQRTIASSCGARSSHTMLLTWATIRMKESTSLHIHALDQKTKNVVYPSVYNNVLYYTAKPLYCDGFIERSVCLSQDKSFIKVYR
ncbi:Hypothetical protein FKW44_020387, partial [Caligus rogercresseyi]